MKFWLPVTALLLLAFTAKGADYRVVYSPSLELEVFIDNVTSNDPSEWCRNPLPLRIVAGGTQNSDTLTRFLPRVGTLLQNQCSTLQSIPWTLTNKEGAVLAAGNASKAQGWKPMITADITPNATASNAQPLDLSQPADRTPLQHFDLPGGCHFRTWWDEQGQSLFIPDDKTLSCSTEGWLEGATRLNLMQGGNSEPLDVQFFEGYPLLHLQPAKNATLEVVSVNRQRMLLSRKEAEDSWLLLPFDPARHVWSFANTLLVKMDKQPPVSAETLKARLESVRQRWADVVPANQPLTILLVNEIHSDLADPAIGAWRTVNNTTGAASGE